MYNLPYHKEKNKQIVHEFIHQHPFAFLTGCDSKNQPVATQVPLHLEEKDGKTTLSGHIMKNTDHHKAFLQNKGVLAVFNGPNTYVSATWYDNPNMASTWNYMSVHVKGNIRFLSDDALENMLQKTSLHFENNNPLSSTVFNNLPQSFKQRVMGAIIAFEIDIVKVDTVFKLSQDRDIKSYLNIIERLKEQDESARAIAHEMQKRLDEVFPSK
jgi:transcriptional regulator